ncbi:thioester-containing protein 1 allele S3-like [Musca autumnalis]|uniref:thioester-containing protein 1 allele S3-like n=1 Tax=Musca autumnalis TaxID=221902 RepID=UPI003CE9E575
MRQIVALLVFVLSSYGLVDGAGESYYSIIAPGVIKSNHKYTVIATLHQALEPAKINIRIEGPSYRMTNDVYLQPHESKSIVFMPQKLVQGQHKLIVEGLSGLIFRNESFIYAQYNAGPKIYIQTDKAVFKPGDEVQFRVLILDEHTRPLTIEEPIRVEVMDGNGNRVKQFKDAKLTKGVYMSKFQLSEYPVLGDWKIRVYISGKYDFSEEKRIRVLHYVLPKFSVYIKTQLHLTRDMDSIKALIYGKYTFDKYVEGNITAKLIDPGRDTILQTKQLILKDTVGIEFPINDPELLKLYGFKLLVELTEKHTGVTKSEAVYMSLHDVPYNIYVATDSIKFLNGRPHRLTADVSYWNGAPVLDKSMPVIMQHGSKEYSAYLNSKGEAIFDFDHDQNSNHIFRFGNATFKLSNIFSDDSIGNKTESYFTLSLKGESLPRLDKPVELVVKSSVDIPYLVYTIMAHSNIIYADYIQIPPGQKTHTIQITPSIEMVPYAFIYVHYIQDGILRYEEIELTFPLEFENQISVTAPKQVKPGQEVTLELNAQPKSLVGLLAVDLGVYLLDSSYDLKRGDILTSLKKDVSSLPFRAQVYPGLVSGVVTFTNAHYTFVPLSAYTAVSPAGLGPLKFRQKFPETWIFQNYEITNEITQLKLQIPETITTWRITAFSINEQTGLGVVHGPTDITTIQPFFISLNLPYSVKRGEIISISILVHNYHEEEVEAEISLFNDAGEFNFMDSTIIQANRGSQEQKRMKSLKVPPNSIGSVAFLINPKQVGDVSLRVSATNTMSQDGVIRKLRVEPEGMIKRHNKPLYINVQRGDKTRATFHIEIPPDVVPQSEFISLSVSGNHLAPTLKNLNGLVLMPTGCGEQNMVNFAPNVLVLQYLRSSGRYFKEKELVAKARNFIEIGYQQQLSYRHGNGGYSVFGQGVDDEPSTWLTAYVLRFFIKASKYLPMMEPHIIDTGLTYLASSQKKDGSFPYTGYLFYPAQQNRYGFTAFVLMTFLENKKFAEKYKTNIDGGIKFLNDNLDKNNDIYALSITAVAMQMAEHSSSGIILDKLIKLGQKSSEHIWWSQNDRDHAKDVEITAYVLMALMYEQQPKNVRGEQLIFKWLTEQRNERGGFKSTHDTVVGLQALVKFSEKYNSLDSLNLRVKYLATDGRKQNLKSGELVVDGNNLLILQSEEFPKSTRCIYIEASGAGNALLQLYYHYHIISEDNFKHFRIQPKAKFLNPEELLVEVCFNYRQDANSDAGGTGTNMIIMETNLPSGFTTSEDYSNELLDNELVDRIELKNSDTTVVMYFEKLSANVDNCFNLMADKINDVTQRKPASVAVYDYYNISRHDTAFYSI